MVRPFRDASAVALLSKFTWGTRTASWPPLRNLQREALSAQGEHNRFAFGRIGRLLCCQAEPVRQAAVHSRAGCPPLPLLLAELS